MNLHQSSLWILKNIQRQVSVMHSFSSLNANAPAFHSKSTPLVLMEPILGVCFAFQFGKCNESDHHRGEDSLALHICQPCLQLRQNLVDHSCSGGHPNHSMSCNRKKLGALACPFHLETASLLADSNKNFKTTTPSSSTENSLCRNCSQFEDHFRHLPAFECNCNMCTKFFWGLQTELKDNGINIDINSEYEAFHYSKSYPDEDHEYQESCYELENEVLCSDCEYAPAEPWSDLCGYCEAFNEEQRTYGYHY